eukprot:gene1082-1634_t
MVRESSAQRCWKCHEYLAVDKESRTQAVGAGHSAHATRPLQPDHQNLSFFILCSPWQASGAVEGPQASGAVEGPQASGTVEGPQASGAVEGLQASGAVEGLQASGAVEGPQAFGADGSIDGGLCSGMQGGANGGNRAHAGCILEETQQRLHACHEVRFAAHSLLAAVYAETKLWEASAKQGKLAIKCMRKVFPKNHPALASTQVQVGDAIVEHLGVKRAAKAGDKEQQKEALKLYEGAGRILRLAYGSEHTDVADIRMKEALLREALGARS